MSFKASLFSGMRRGRSVKVLFVERTGYSPNEYIRTARLKKASYLLAATDLTVSEVGYAVGFSSSSYFAKCYKEYFGENPRGRKSH